MKHKRLKLCALFLLVLGLTNMQAQEAILTSGGDASGSGGSSSYSVGQLFYHTYSGTEGSAAEGVQQPYEISIHIGIENTEGIQLLCKIYPNPTQDYLNLIVDNYDISNLSFQLYDITGKLIVQKRITNIETKINMLSLAPAVYFLRVLDQDKSVKVFRVIKK